MASRSRCVSIAMLLAAAASSFARPALAEPPPRARVWDRITFDWGYELALAHVDRYADLYSSDPAAGREASAFGTNQYNTASQGLVLGLAFSTTHWFGIGPEASFHEDFSAPGRNPRFDRVGVRFGRARTLGLGVAVEFRPGQRTYDARSGWFFPLGLRVLLTDRRATHGPALVKPEDGYSEEGALVWGGVGYRVALGSGVSFHVRGYGGMGEGVLAGIRIGGGFH